MAAPADAGGGGRRMVNMLEAKTHLARLVEAIESREATKVVIARNGRPVARLTALQGPARPRRLGVARGQFTVPESIDAANPLIAKLFEQVSTTPWHALVSMRTALWPQAETLRCGEAGKAGTR